MIRDGKEPSCPIWVVHLVRAGLTGLLFVASANADKPLPPPVTLEQTVRSATLIFVGTGIELLPHGRDGSVVARGSSAASEVDAGVFGYYLKTQVNQILYCADPCPNHEEVTIALGLSPLQQKMAKELFVGTTQIFLVVDRPFGPGIPVEFADSWFARNDSATGFVLPVEQRSRVISMIKKYKVR